MRDLRDLLKSQSIVNDVKYRAVLQNWEYKGSIKKPLWEYKKYDINCLLEQYYEGVLCKCNMPLNL